MTKGYIFDYGGTIDTGGCHWGKMLWHAYERHHVNVSESQFRDAYVHAERSLGSNPIIQSGYTFHKTLDVKIKIEMEYLLADCGWDVTESEFHHCHKAVLDDLYAKVKAHVDESRRVLERLKAEHHPMVLVSNFYGNINVVLSEFGLDGYFDQVVESAVVGIRKPDPRIFLLGVEALGLNADDITVVGDSFYKDILPAKKAGCHTAWLKGEGWTDETYDETIPDKVICSLHELL